MLNTLKSTAMKTRDEAIKRFCRAAAMVGLIYPQWCNELIEKTTAKLLKEPTVENMAKAFNAANPYRGYVEYNDFDLIEKYMQMSEEEFKTKFMNELNYDYDK